MQIVVRKGKDTRRGDAAKRFAPAQLNHLHWWAHSIKPECVACERDTAPDAMDLAPQALAREWLNYHRALADSRPLTRMGLRGDTAHQAPVQALHDLTRVRPAQAWQVIRLIAGECSSDVERACLGAGVLEDLLVRHGAAFIGEVEELALVDTAFARALQCVWRSGISADVWRRLQRVLMACQSAT